jgi:hypothetical protein
MLAAIRDLANKFQGGDWQSEGSQAVSLYLSVVEARLEREEIQSAIRVAVQQATGLNFAVHLVLSCHKSRGGPWHRVFAEANMNELRNVARDRLNEYYVAGGRDIMAELPNEEWGFVLYQWATNWMTEQSPQPGEVNDYVLQLTDRTPSHLGRVLTRFVEERDRGDSFDYARFLSMYDAPEFARRLNDDFDRYAVDQSARSAAGLFLQSYERRQETATETALDKGGES